MSSMLPASVKQFKWLVDKDTSIPRSPQEIAALSPYLQSWSERVILATINDNNTYSPYYIVQDAPEVAAFIESLPEVERKLCVEIEGDKPVAFYLDVDLQKEERLKEGLPGSEEVGWAIMNTLQAFSQSIGFTDVELYDDAWFFGAHQPDRKLSFHIHFPTLVFVNIEHTAAFATAFRSYLVEQMLALQPDALLLQIKPKENDKEVMNSCIDKKVYHHHRAIRLPFCHKPGKPNLIYDAELSQQTNKNPTFAEQIMAALPQHLESTTIIRTVPDDILSSYRESKSGGKRGQRKKRGQKRKREEDNVMNSMDPLSSLSPPSPLLPLSSSSLQPLSPFLPSPLPLSSTPILPFLTVDEPLQRQESLRYQTLSELLKAHKRPKKDGPPANLLAFSGHIHGGTFIIPDDLLLEVLRLSYISYLSPLSSWRCNSLTETRSLMSAMTLDFEVYVEGFLNPFVPSQSGQSSITTIIQQTMRMCFPDAPLQCVMCQASGYDKKRKKLKSSYRIVWSSIHQTAEIQETCAERIQEALQQTWGDIVAQGVDLTNYKPGGANSRLL